MTDLKAGVALTADWWSGWIGGENPFEKSSMLEVRRRDGKTFYRWSAALDFTHKGQPSDIIAFRPVSDHVGSGSIPASREAVIPGRENDALSADLACTRAYRDGLRAGFQMGEHGEVERYETALANYQRSIQDETARSANSVDELKERDEVVSAVAAAIEEADSHLGYSNEMIRLVDGVTTRRLKIAGETYEFTDDDSNDYDAHGAASEVIAKVRNKLRADAVLEVLADGGHLNLARYPAKQDEPEPQPANERRAGG